MSTEDGEIRYYMGWNREYLNSILEQKRNQRLEPQLHANLTEEGHTLLTLIAKANGLTVTAYLENHARTTAKRMKIRYDPTLAKKEQ